MNIRQDVKPEHAFYCADGTVLKNLKELAGKLKTISPEVYAHHANAHRNDFHNWIKEVYGNAALARKMASAKSSLHAARTLENGLKKPKKKLKREPTARKESRDNKKTMAIKPVKRPKKKQLKIHRIHKRIHKHVKAFAKRCGII